MVRAAEKGDLKLLERMIFGNFAPFAPRDVENISNALVAAAENGHLEAVKLLFHQIPANDKELIRCKAIYVVNAAYEKKYREIKMNGRYKTLGAAGSRYLELFEWLTEMNNNPWSLEYALQQRNKIRAQIK